MKSSPILGIGSISIDWSSVSFNSTSSLRSPRSLSRHAMDPVWIYTHKHTHTQSQFCQFAIMGGDGRGGEGYGRGTSCLSPANLVLQVSSGSGELHSLSLQFLPGLSKLVLLCLVLAFQPPRHLLKCFLHFPSNLRERERVHNIDI